MTGMVGGVSVDEDGEAFVLLPRPRGVSVRELEVLRLVADGLSNEAIAHRLGVSVDTVKSHTVRLYRRLGARDRANAVDVGWRRGLLP